MFVKLIKQSLKFPPEKMERVTEIIDGYIEKKDDKWELFYALDLYINGDVFVDEMAEKAVKCFVDSKTGAHGPFWTRSQTDALMSKLGVSMNSANFYVLANKIYSDYAGFVDEDVLMKLVNAKAHDKDSYPGMLKHEVYEMLAHTNT